MFLCPFIPRSSSRHADISCKRFSQPALQQKASERQRETIDSENETARQRGKAVQVAYRVPSLASLTVWQSRAGVVGGLNKSQWQTDCNSEWRQTPVPVPRSGLASFLRASSLLSLSIYLSLFISLVPPRSSSCDFSFGPREGSPLTTRLVRNKTKKRRKKRKKSQDSRNLERKSRCVPPRGKLCQERRSTWRATVGERARDRQCPGNDVRRLTPGCQRPEQSGTARSRSFVSFFFFFSSSSFVPFHRWNRDQRREIEKTRVRQSRRLAIRRERSTRNTCALGQCRGSLRSCDRPISRDSSEFWQLQGSTMMARWNGMFERAGSALLATLFVVSLVKSEEKESSLSPTAAMVSAVSHSS